jgi:hypothetical protein
MGAFGALAGFSGDLKDAVLIFPTDGASASETARGRPELSFPFTPQKSGYWRLFIQTKTNGLKRFASFGVNVAAPPQF